MNKPTCSLAELFTAFAKIGAVTFGGGASMLPMIKKTVVDDKKWLEEQDFVDTIAISNALPGAIAVNIAVYIGFKLRGVAGAVAGVLGAAIPSFVIILLLAFLLESGKDISIVNDFFWGVRPAVVALILYAAFNLHKACIRSAGNWIFFACALVLALLSLFNPIFLILAGILAGMLCRGLGQKKEGKA